jgi:hypothetical protein
MKISFYKTYGFIGSSETRCEKSFSFLSSFCTICTKTKIKQLNDFDYWFIGFSEGDGGFYFDPSSNRFYFKLRQKDPKVLYKVRKYLNFGVINKGKDGYFTYSVTSLKHIEILIKIFNGNLLLNKTNIKFYKNWLENYNILFPGKKILYKGPGTFVGFKNAWLCGFTDAEGSLGFHLQKDSSRKCGFRLRIKWYVDQSFEKEFFEKMKDILGFGHIEKKIIDKSAFSSSNDAWRFKVDSFKNLDHIKIYFDKYKPLTTKIFVRLIRFNRVLNWVNKKEWQSRMDEIKHLIKLNKKL